MTPQQFRRKFLTELHLVFLIFAPIGTLVMALFSYPLVSDQPRVALLTGAGGMALCYALIWVGFLTGKLKPEPDPASVEYKREFLKSSYLARWACIAFALGLVLILMFPPWWESNFMIKSAGPWSWAGFHPVWNPPEPSAQFYRVTRCPPCLAAEFVILFGGTFALLLWAERRFQRQTGRRDPRAG